LVQVVQAALDQYKEQMALILFLAPLRLQAVAAVQKVI
jgi:hypothetical protein